MTMERIVYKASDFDDARRYEIAQYQAMTPEERQAVAKVLRERVYGKNCPDIRDLPRTDDR